MAKIMVVSYSKINGIPAGRFEKGNAIAYSAEWDFKEFSQALLFDERMGMSKPKESVFDLFHEEAEETLSGLLKTVSQDLVSVETVYLYVGLSAMSGGMDFIRVLKNLGKTVHMIACQCNKERKIALAKKLEIDIIWSDCSGAQKYSEIFEQSVGQ